jgi:hypothetical protein
MLLISPSLTYFMYVSVFLKPSQQKIQKRRLEERYVLGPCTAPQKAKS